MFDLIEFLLNFVFISMIGLSNSRRFECYMVRLLYRVMKECTL